MDTIYKTINIDNSRSHRSGLLPFVRFNGHAIEETTNLEPHGNYGNYVCDFCIFSNDEHNKELARLKYLDIIRWYDETNNILKNSLFVKKTIFTKSTIKNVNCGKDNYSNPNTVIETEEIPTIGFYENFNEKNNFSRLSYNPISKQFISFGNTFIEFNESNEYINAINTDEDKRTEYDNYIISEFEKQKSLIESNDNTYFIILADYDKVYDLNKRWLKWWDENFNENDWEYKIFNGYKVNPYDNIFKFCYDVERYILGVSDVYGENISGIKVPETLYYTTIFDKMEWFESKSGITKTAYETKNSDSEWIIREWEENGGGDFYDFLSNINFQWQTNKTVYNSSATKIFKYSPPLIEIQTMINSEYDYETLYDTYEYSIIRNRKVGAVNYYFPPENDIVYVEYVVSGDTIQYVNSYYEKDTLGTTTIDGVKYYTLTEDTIKANGLTKQWVEFNNGELMCESKLNTLKHPSSVMIDGNIYGIYKNYDLNNPSKGQMFKCTYTSGTSEEPEIICTHMIITTEETITYDENGEEVITIQKFYTDARDGDQIFDIPPKVGDETYQVIGTTIFSSTTETKILETSEDYYESAITWYHYAWWNCEKVDDDIAEKLICGDGEYIEENNDKKYQNITILADINNVVSNKKNGDYYYFMSRFDNGVSTPLDVKGSGGTINTLSIPYKVGYPLNIMEYDDGTIIYDVVTSIDESNAENGYVTIRYSKGVTSGSSENTGILYEEIIPYIKNNVENVTIDGAKLTELYYDKLLLDNSKVEVSSEEYKLTRKTNLASIIGAEIGTQWTEQGAVNALLITKEGSEGLYWEPKYNIDMLYNRGNAAAWEKRFKLSECNTMEDLVNYGNNFFNL